MDVTEFYKWIHLLGAAVWTGGLIVLAGLVVALRRENVDRSVLQAVARQFGRISWTALAVLVVTGILQVNEIGLPWSDTTLTVKLTLVVIAAGLALGHQLTARRSSPAVRGIIQALILVVSIAIFGVAVTL